MEYIPHNWESHTRWSNDKGDDTHRLNYPLDENSIVFDVGGYEGWFANKIFNKYKSNIYVFEPVTEFYENIKNKFSNNNKIKVFHFGLGAKTEFVEMDLDTDGSSYIANKNSKKETVKIKSIIEFLSEEKLDIIDLIKINIECAEFDLLDHIIEESKTSCFKNIQVQFHTFIPDCVERRDKIRKNLSETHQITYDYEFIWENWKIKEKL